MHAPFPPSSAHIWGSPDGCRGWRNMMQSVGEVEESEAAREGTTAHEVCARWLHMCKNSGGRAQDPGVSAGTIAPSTGTVITEEMIECAKGYVEYVLNHVQPTSMVIETSVTMKMIGPQVWGTPDCYAIAGNTLHVFDYKHGHKPVDAIGNLQGVCYLLGAFDTLDHAIRHMITDVKFHIYQPRARHRDGVARSWGFTSEKLFSYAEPLNRAFIEGSSPNAQVRTGKHCRDCDAKLLCPAAVEQGLSLYELLAESTPVELTINGKAVLYSILLRSEDHIKGLKTALEEELSATIKSGKAVPGYELRETFGRTVWNKPVADVINFGKLFGVDLSKNDVVTPAQAIEKAKGTQLSKELIASLSERPSKGVKLQKYDSDRVAMIFGGK